MGSGGGTVSVDGDPIPTFHAWLIDEKVLKKSPSPNLRNFAHFARNNEDFPQNVDADTKHGEDVMGNYCQKFAYNHKIDVTMASQLFRNLGYAWAAYCDHVEKGRHAGRYAC